MKQGLTIAVLVAAALGSGAAIAQEQKAAQSAANAAAKSTQVAQAGGAAATTGGASAGAATATTATVSFGTAVVTSAPFIGITAGMAAVGNAASNGNAATQH